MPVKKKVSKEPKASKVTSRLASARSKNNIVRAQSRTTALSVPVYSLVGRASGTMTLPKEIFGQKVNKKLLSQAIRVYATNQKSLTGFTKTRGEVEGSTAKIFRQKGTGRARHGAIRAPIFVGGGIAFGPKPRKVKLDLPQRMKKAALLSAFSVKVNDNQLMGLSGIEKASGKTKELVKLMDKLLAVSHSPLAAKIQKLKAKSALIVTGEKQDNIVRAVRNIPGVDVSSVSLINAYEILKHELLLITKEAVEKLSKGGQK